MREFNITEPLEVMKRVDYMRCVIKSKSGETYVSKGDCSEADE